jgi:NAD-dependent DNA ligase
MKTYVLTTPKDAHGQPLRMFKANLENNVSKAIDQLSGICSGILADGVVTEAEAQFFAEWVRKFAPYEPVWPFTDILARVERIFANGRCDDEERAELQSVMEALCGHRKEAQPDETRSTTLPLDSPQPEPLVFPGQQFVVTGRFAYGTRRKVFEAIEALGGVCGDSAPTLTTRYLVIGVFASRDWYNTNYGRKIERAVELRDSGTGISIVSEEHWKRFLQPTGNA